MVLKSRQWITGTLSLILLIQGCGSANSSLPQPDRPSRNLVAEELDRPLQKVLDNTIIEQDIPGMVLFVSTPEQVWQGAAGVTNLETPTPMQPSDRFRIASISKMFVATVTLQLVEEDKLSLEDTLTDRLPEDIADGLPNTDEITIRQLLQHTSGLADYIDNNDFDRRVENTSPTHVWTAREAIAYAYDLEPEFDPDEDFYYSNTNYLALELIIEEIAGTTLAEVLRSRIHSPLGLNDTFTEGREILPGEFVVGYEDWDGDGEPDNMNQYNEGYGLGDGGLISTARDLAMFARVLLADEELLDPNTFDEMLDWVEDGDGNLYGLGVSAWDSEWGEVWGHDGRSGGFLSTLWYLPEEEAIVVVWANDGDNADPNEIAEAALRLILD